MNVTLVHPVFWLAPWCGVLLGVIALIHFW